MDWVSARWIVGVYSPVGVDSAILISACGRIVNVGLEVGDELGVMEARKSGHSSMDLDSVLSKMGR